MANSLMLSSQTKDEVNYAARFMELGLIVGNILATESLAQHRQEEVIEEVGGRVILIFIHYHILF